MVGKSILENGVRIVTERVEGAHSVTIGLWVENGSRHESVLQSGISHFLEHMLFKGTERRSALDISREIDSVGGFLNGFTGREYSCYYIRILAEHLPIAVDLLVDIAINSRLDTADIEKERRVILQELHMLEDTPDDLVHDLFSQTFWGDHPLGQSILGSVETVSTIGREDLIDFHQRHYCARRMIVSAAGDLEHETLVEQFAQIFSRLTHGEEMPLSSLPDYGRHAEVVERDHEQVHLCLGARGLPQNHPNRFALYLLNTILGSSMSSRLFQRVREDRGLAYSIYSYLNSHTDAGSLVLYAGTAPDDAIQVIELMLAELRRLRNEEVSDEELTFAKRQLRGNLLLSMESTDNRMTRLAKNEIYLGQHPSYKDVLAGFSRVTPEALRKLAEFICQDSYLNLQMVGPVNQVEYERWSLSLD
ncbi:MAG: peptidase M16 [Desulfuromonas sp.]|mgnify:CR=1 FL=1|nr:MAG: peptidase M16 [Desulfuromonas sp.]